MNISYGREICGNLSNAESREWLVTNGIGGYACGTLAGLLTRCYHGLLIAALKPPLARTLLLTKLEETIQYNHQSYPCFSNRWADGTIEPHGYVYIENFHLEGTIPVWTFACGDALIEKRIWMQLGSNTTYIRYTVKRAGNPVQLNLKAFVNYRAYHGNTQAEDWQILVRQKDQDPTVEIEAFADAVPFYLWADSGEVILTHEWYRNFDLAVERYRGLGDREDHLYVATFTATLNPGESLTTVASTHSQFNRDGKAALQERYNYEQQLLKSWRSKLNQQQESPPDWIEHLVLAADQFIVNRPLADETEGKTIIAGYPWFEDWGRDITISLPGLTLATGRPEIARQILRTFAQYLDRGMLPNLFPERGETPAYNTVDAVLWYFEAIRAYYDSTGDKSLIKELFPSLAAVIDWHRRGTRYQIHLDEDGLIYAGEAGVQLTWMDAKVGDWVVTPRIGKPIEVNALWYNALAIMGYFAHILGKSAQEYEQMAVHTHQGFQRFWQPSLNYCYDVLDTPDGNDDALRPNQIFAVSLPVAELNQGFKPLLSLQQQQAVVDIIAQQLLTSHGLRSLSSTHPQYQGHYGGDQLNRDRAYHQGTVWAWLLGHFVQAHLRVYNDPAQARTFLEPMANHLQAGCVGSLSEIFDGDVPLTPRGCFAQAWSVAEVLRSWLHILLNEVRS